MPIESNRSLGGAAAILSAIGIISSFITILRFTLPSTSIASLTLLGISGVIAFLSFIGFILYLVAMYGFSKDYAERKIFCYLLIGIVLTIIVVVAATISLVFLVLATQISNPSTAATSLTNAFAYTTPIFGGASIIWVLYNVKAFNLLSDKSGVPLFRTGAWMLLAGAIMTVIFEVAFTVVSVFTSMSISSFTNSLTVIAVPGAIVQGVAWVLFAKSYYRITPPPAQTAPPYSYPPISPQAQYCPNCGTQHHADARFCTHCGQKL